MALNLLMHPRNPYRNKRPDFKALAEKYELFREQVTSDAKGKVHVDFKNPACLRALTWALLKNDFDLDIKLPLDRLIPTVPLRLNYILWLEDIFQNLTSSPLRGIDIGAGAACIYSLLGAQTRGWSFVATEADLTNAEYAVENISRNRLTDKIKVVQVSEDTSLSDAISRYSEEDPSTFDFCMCNPPFFGSNLEAWGWLTTRGVGPDGDGDRKRSEPSSINTASPVESIAPGGEVQFVQERIIESSLVLQNRVRVYSTMLGKKTSLNTLKCTLKMHGITNFGTTEFCQGKTMRWGLAWSFDNTVIFPKPVSKVVKEQKPRPPIVLNLQNTCINSLASVIERIFEDLQVSFVKGSSSAEKATWIVDCVSNTWSHQRRRRRQQRLQNPPVNNTDSVEGTPVKRERDHELNCSDSVEELAPKRVRLNCPTSGGENVLAKCVEDSDGCPPLQEAKDDGRCLKKSEYLSSEGEPTVGSGSLLKTEVALRKSDKDSSLVAEFSLVDGQNRELLHQFVQYFKNRLL